MSKRGNASDSQADGTNAELVASVYRDLLTRLGEGTPQPRLEPARRVLDFLGDVQRTYPIIHITGTNGKTSTARMIEAILRALGLRTGLFTSPHLVSFAERIAIDGQPISGQALLATWAEVAPYVELVDTELSESGEPRLTFFEVLTVLAFAAFADAPVDVAVVEVGMGGEWDSTNVADGAVAVFTPIALDHTDRLGATLEHIARTKSGIIKPASMVVSAPQDPVVLEILRQAADMTESIVNVLGSGGTSVVTEMAVGGQVLSVIGLAGTYDDVFLDLFGDHQSVNAAVAVMAVESFLGGASQELDHEILAEAFATVSSPGRLQVISTEPTVIVDAAHNPHGAQALAEALTTYFVSDDVTLVVGVLSDKDYTTVLETLAPMASHLVVTTAPSERAADARELAQVASTLVVSVDVEPDPAVAIATARARAAMTDNGIAVVTGSITLVGLAIEMAAREGWA